MIPKKAVSGKGADCIFMASAHEKPRHSSTVPGWNQGEKFSPAGGTGVPPTPQFGIVALRALCLIAASSAFIAHWARRTPPPPSDLPVGPLVLPGGKSARKKSLTRFRCPGPTGPFVGENDPLDHFPGPPHPAPYMPLLRISAEGVHPLHSPPHGICFTPIPSPQFAIVASDATAFDALWLTGPPPAFIAHWARQDTAPTVRPAASSAG